MPRCGAFELGGWEGKGLLTWPGGSGQFCLGPLLGGLQQDLPHLQTDMDVSLPKHCPDPPLPPHTLDLCRTQRSTDILTGASPVTAPFIPWPAQKHSQQVCPTVPHTFWLRVRSRDVWQRRCLCPACQCPCVEGLELVLCSAARAGSPRSMASSCSSGSVSVSLLASDEDRLMGSSFSHKTSAPVRKGWCEPGSDLVPGTTQHRQPELWGGKEEGQCLTSFKEQFGEGGGAQASSQVQGGVPSESPAVDVCSQLRKV